MDFGGILIQGGVVIHDKGVTNLRRSDTVHQAGIKEYLIFCGNSMRGCLSGGAGRRHGRTMAGFNPDGLSRLCQRGKVNFFLIFVKRVRISICCDLDWNIGEALLACCNEDNLDGLIDDNIYMWLKTLLTK